MQAAQDHLLSLILLPYGESSSFYSCYHRLKPWAALGLRAALGLMHCACHLAVLSCPEAAVNPAEPKAGAQATEVCTTPLAAATAAAALLEQAPHWVLVLAHRPKALAHLPQAEPPQAW